MVSPSPSPPEERLQLGSVLDGRYRVDSLVGIGGMGSVYRSEHVGIGRPVAIKVLHADFIGNREASSRFQREALASGRLDHPNIVGVSDFGLLDDGGCYLVMELLEGETLGSRLERERIPWRDAVGILRGVLRGLRHAHDRGVVHRDIKPDNVFLAVKDGDPITKILDFGIAKLFAGVVDDPAATRTGITVGTPAYLSPEQAVGGEITPASDLYSTTVLFFEMLTGRPPFDDQDPMAILGAHVGRPPPRARDLAPELELPDELEEILQRGLAKTPVGRFTDANEYLRALALLLPATAPRHRSGVGGGTDQVPALGRATTSGDEDLLGSSSQHEAVPNAFDDTGDLTVRTARAAQLASLPRRPQTATSGGPTAEELAEPIPRRYLAGGGAVVLVLFLAALLLAWRKAPPAPVPSPAPAPAALDPALVALLSEGLATRQRQVNDALAVLETSKKCKDVKGALAELVRAGDRRAAKLLQETRARLSADTSACLGADLAAAIKRLEQVQPLAVPGGTAP